MRNKQYELSITLEKLADKWIAENGAEGKPHTVDFRCFKMEINSEPLKCAEQIFSRIYEETGIERKDWNYFSGEDGRFVACRVEDDDGSPDPNGNWLCDYSINIECREVKPFEPLQSHLGCDSI